MNEQETLHAFLRSKAKTPPPPEEEIDWPARKEEWLDAIDRLYDLVKSWLQPLERDGTLRYLTEQNTLREDYLESYDVDVLILLIGNQRIRFDPKGTLIVGAAGRVDVRGRSAVRTLVLNEGQWFVLERSPRLRTVLFNEDSFQNLLKEVME